MTQTTPEFSFDMCLYRGRHDREYEVEVTYTAAPIIPAQTSGPAELCHPAEGGEVEVQKVTYDGAIFVTSAEEDQQIHDHACDRADQDLAGWRDDYSNDRSDT